MAPQLYSIGAILLSTAFLLLGNGLIGTLTPVRAHLEGFSNMAIGAMGSFYYLGFVVGCFVGPRLLARVGHIRTFAVAAALTAATVLLQPIFTLPAMWFADRAVFGSLAAIVYMAIESWLNDRATNETRGRILSAYVIVNLGCLTLGQWLLLAAPPMGYQLFSLAAVLYIFCVVPMGLTHLPQPAPQPHPVLRVMRLARMAPVGIAGVVTVGLANAAFWTLAPVYAQSLGFSTFGVALFMSAFILGGTAIQFPLGRFSDRLDRRWIIAAICAAASVGGVALALLGHVSAEHPYLLYPARPVFRRRDAAALFAVDRACQRPAGPQRIHRSVGDAAARECARLDLGTVACGLHHRAQFDAVIVLLHRNRASRDDGIHRGADHNGARGARRDPRAFRRRAATGIAQFARTRSARA